VSGAATTEVTIPNFVQGVFYTITVVATNEINSSVPSAPLSFSYGTVPDPPTDVSGIGGNESITLSWTAPINTGGYPITSYTVQELTYGATQDVSGDVFEAIFTGLTNGQTYSFTVAATNYAGTSIPSESRDFVPGIVTGQPPTAVTATFDSTNYPGVMFISWTAPTDTGGLTIFRYSIDTVGFSFNSESTTFSTPYLTPGLEYSFTVTAVFVEGGESPPSVPSDYILFGPPRPPTNVAAQYFDASSMLVTWAVPVTDGGYPISSYTVTLEPGTITTSVTTTGAVIPDCTFGETYTITVVATNSLFDSAASDPLSYLFIKRPDPPTDVSANVIGSRTVFVQWTPPVFDGGSAIQKYRVISIPGSVVDETAGPDTSLQLHFPPQPPNNYTFIVLAINEVGPSLNSLPSNQVTV